MSKIALDVGAQYGQEAELFLSEGYTVYAFDPAPDMYKHLTANFGKHSGFFPVPMGVDIENRWARFGITLHGGCSSIHQFNPNIQKEWTNDIPREDFTFIDATTIMMIRLDTFMEIYGIDKVEYLWIDAQGNDLNVLKSLGNRVSDVRQGRCEVAYRTNLYANVVNDHVTVNTWLSDAGFITRVVPHDHGNEADIMFWRE